MSVQFWKDLDNLFKSYSDKQAGCWGFKIKGWWRKGDIHTTNPRKSDQESLTETLMSPQNNVGKDAYTVDLEMNEKLYWLGTESGLLRVFGFEGAFTVGDDSCDPPTKRKV